MDVKTLLMKSPSSIAGGENKKPNEVELVIDLTSPPTKKLKQARLPFKVLTPKAVTSPRSTNSVQKKRKLSDPQPDLSRLAKTPKSDITEGWTCQTGDYSDDQKKSILGKEDDTQKTNKNAVNKSECSRLIDCYVKLKKLKESPSDTVAKQNCGSTTSVGEETTTHQVNHSARADQLAGAELVAGEHDEDEEAQNEALISEVKKLIADNSSTSEVADKENSLKESGDKETATEQVPHLLLSDQLEGTDLADGECDKDKNAQNEALTSEVKNPVADNSSTSELADKEKESITGESDPKYDELDAEKALATKEETVAQSTNISQCLDSSAASEANQTLETCSDHSQDGSNTKTLDTTDGANISSISGTSSLNSSFTSDGLSQEESTPPHDANSSIDLNTSSQVTPKCNRISSAGLKRNTSSRKKDPEKQKEKELARLERQKQRELARAEKERQRLEAKAKKEQERLEAKRKREEEKLRLQKEREEKLQQKEEERKKRQLEKEEEKRKKQELAEAKNEEKKKKDEERLRAQEELKLKKEKEKALFTKFFTKTDKQLQPAKSEEEKTGPFIAFEVKDNMRLAPVFRVDETTRKEKAANVDRVINNQEESVLYLDELKQKSYKPGHAIKTWPLTRDVDVEVIPDNPTYHLRAKLLQFHENYRPAYYGTWRKRSRVINPRNPLRKDQGIFNYEVESDDEWEEEEPGESLSHSEGECSDDEKDDVVDDAVDDDGFFVPHGYLSEGEGCEDEDEDISPERLKARQLAKARAWESEMKRKKLEVLKPICIGCLWSDMRGLHQRDPDWERLQQYSVVPLVPTPISLTVESQDETLNTSSKTIDRKENPRLMPVPKEAIPDLIRLVHGSTFGLNKLIREFREYWQRKSRGTKTSEENDKTDTTDNQSAADGPNADGPAADDTTGVKCTEEADSCCDITKENTPDKSLQIMSKRQLSAMIHVLAVYEKRADIYNKCCWYVHQEELDKYNLTDLPVPTRWDWLTRPKAEVTPTKRDATPIHKSKMPTKQHTPKSSLNIKHFAVAGYTPPIRQSPTLTNGMPTSNMVANHTQKPSQKATIKTTPKCHRKTTTPSAQNQEQRNEFVSSTPVKSDIQEVKNRENVQRTLASMFSPLQKKNPLDKMDSAAPSLPSNTTSDNTSVKSVDCRPGDNADLPMEIN